MTSSHPERAIFVNRTLNLRSIKAIGYDMDYTLVQYHAEQWEERAFSEARDRLAASGWPVGHLAFEPESVIRGLTLDLELGNLVKATRFGYVISAAHGGRFLEFDEVRNAYHGTVVDPAEERFVFMNTLFSLSESSLFAQLVPLFDAGELRGVAGYRELYASVRQALDTSHVEGALKQMALADPERFIEPDPLIAQALVDQRSAGKRLMLITNSDWEYTRAIMPCAIDPHLPAGMTWRDLFEAIIVSAGKPGFFTGNNPLYKVVDEDAATLRPHLGTIDPGSVFFGGNAPLVEESCGLSGAEILYVGDHLYSDVSVSKALHRWRTALILRELEDEVTALLEFAATERKLSGMMTQKAEMEHRLATMRLERLRAGGTPRAGLDADMEQLRADLAAFDEQIAPLAKAAGALHNPQWGPLMRAGVDKSLFARQVEKYADIYTSRVSNFVDATPFGYLRASRPVLPHDVE
jgi:HAD superfamily 5'-nucleotidase-like hydrolase